MVEVWLRYGRTMIFTDIEENLEILKNNKTWNEPQKLREEIISKIQSEVKKIVVDYVYGVEKYDQVVETVLSAMREKQSSFEQVLVSCWRYGDPSVEKTLFNIVKNTISEQGFKQITHLTSFDGVDFSSALVVSPSIYWEGQIVCWRDFYDFAGADGGYVVSPVVGCGGVVTDVLVGENLDEQETAKATKEAASYTATNNPEILLVGGPGHPVDAKLSTCINLASAVAETEPNKVVVYAFECSEGLGDNEFIKNLLGKTFSQPHAKRVTVWRNAASKHKLCVVTALPSTFVDELLNAKHADTLDQAMVYGRRVKTREAAVLVVENALGTWLTGF